MSGRYVALETVAIEVRSDGSQLLVSKQGFLEPSKSSKLKPKDLLRPILEHEVQKVNLDAAVIDCIRITQPT